MLAINFGTYSHILGLNGVVVVFENQARAHQALPREVQPLSNRLDCLSRGKTRKLSAQHVLTVSVQSEEVNQSSTTPNAIPLTPFEGATSSSYSGTYEIEFHSHKTHIPCYLKRVPFSSIRLASINARLVRPHILL
jgi:hypothetical protein